MDGRSSFCEVVPQQLSDLGVLFLDLLLGYFFSFVILADEEVEGDDLAFLFHIDHFVAELRDAVEVQAGEGCILAEELAVSDDVKQLLENLSDEVKKNTTAIAWDFLLEDVHLLDSQYLCFVDARGVLQEGRLLHDVPLGLNEDNVEHINEVFDHEEHFLKLLLGTQGKGEVVGKGNEILADAALDEGEDVCVVVIFGDLYIFLSVVDDLLGEVVMQTRQEMVGNDEPAA